jgi:hypothetical protein
MSSVDLLVTVRREHASRYYKGLSAHKDFRVQIVSDVKDALELLADKDKHVDVFVIDNNMGDVYELISELRQTYPRLIIVLVDEEADFGMPGQADEITTEPFENDDLARRINRLMSDRRLETLRADSLPAVRTFAKQLRTATGEGGKYQVAVEACKQMGYDYVAYYRLDSAEPLQVTLKAQDGSNPIKSVAPKQGTNEDIIGWVGKNGQSRVAGPTDTPTHPLVAKGRLGAVACVPVVFSGKRYGVLVACREQPGTINQENVMMLELVSSQLAAAISKENIG